MSQRQKSVPEADPDKALWAIPSDQAARACMRAAGAAAAWEPQAVPALAPARAEVPVEAAAVLAPARARPEVALTAQTLMLEPKSILRALRLPSSGLFYSCSYILPGRYFRPKAVHEPHQIAPCVLEWYKGLIIIEIVGPMENLSRIAYRSMVVFNQRWWLFATAATVCHDSYVLRQFRKPRFTYLHMR
jgi:hypothetical protein